MKKRKMKLFVISILYVLVLLSLLNFVSGGGKEECAPNSKTNIYNYFGSRCAPCSTKGFSTTGGNLVKYKGNLYCYYCDDYSSCASPDIGTRTEVCPAPISSCCATDVVTYRCQNNTNEDDLSGYYILKKEK